jgi:hypothetical protein
MAIFYQNYAGFKISTDGTTYVDLSDHVQSVTVNNGVDELSVDAMGSTGHQFIGGLASPTIAVDFLNDDASASVMQTLNTLVGTVAKFKVIQTTTAAGSASNPIYSGLVLVNKLTPVAGKVGDVAVQSLTFTVSGSITVTPSGTF